MKFTAPLLATLIAAAAPAIADELEITEDPFAVAAEAEPAPTPAQAAFVFEWVEVDHRTANKLVRKHGDQLSARPLRAELGELIGTGKAKLLQTAYLNARHLQRAKTRSIDEHIYPTEYDPPEIPMEIKRNQRIEELITTPAFPTAFDVRDVGTKVEIEPEISGDGKTVTLNLAPEVVELLRDRDVRGNAKKVPDPLAVIRLPAFYLTRLKSELTLNANDFTLAAMFTPPGETGKRILLIVRNQIIH